MTDRANTSSLEKGLAEDLVIDLLRALHDEPKRDGFVGAHAAPQSMVRKLVLHLGCSGRDVTTCSEVRSGAIRVHRSDVALYSFDGVAIMEDWEDHLRRKSHKRRARGQTQQRQS